MASIPVQDMLSDVLYDKIATEDHHRISRQSVVDFTFDFKFNLIVAPLSCDDACDGKRKPDQSHQQRV